MSFRDMGARKDFCNTRIGPLQRQLWKGEYGLFKYSPMLESDFVQISKQGGSIEVTNEEQIMTVGISFTKPVLRMPDVLLVARPIYLSEDPNGPHDTKYHPDRKVKYELSRLFPLCLVKISIHNAERQQLRVKLASGRTFYLQLCPKSDREEYLFDSWIRIIQLLWPPSETKSEKKEKANKSSRIRSSPPRLKTPSPKCPAERTTSGSKETITKSLMGKKHKKKNSKKNPSKAKSPVSMGKAQDPAPPARTEQEAELDSPPPPPRAKEVTEALEEELGKRNPSRKTGKEGRHERSPTTSRRTIKQSHRSQSRSGPKGATRKPSKLLSLIRSCFWANPRKESQVVGSQSKKKKRSAE